MSGTVKLNQAGFTPREKKTFIYSFRPGEKIEPSFHIVDARGEKVFEGLLGRSVYDRDSKDRVSAGDFSGLSKPGIYIVIAGLERSHSFEISHEKYRNILYTSMRSYFLQRCGMEINDPVSGVKHAACHLRDSFPDNLPPEEGFLDTAGGWHDAGDYGKYIATAAISVSAILMMYELSPAAFENFSLDIPVPAGTGKLPDILSEIKYELDWMLKMQDKSDGGVYHKVNTHNFPSLDTAPEDDLLTRFHYSKGTADTSYFAASTAAASRVFKKYDPDYAAVLEKASVLAGDFLIKSEGIVLEPSNGKTGTYRITRIEESLCWAFAGLYRLTGVSSYLDMFLKNWKGRQLSLKMDWRNVSFPSVYELLNCPGIPKRLHRKWTAEISALARKISSRISSNGYRTALVWDEYEWASIKTTLTYGMALILAGKFVGIADLEDMARCQLDYALGVNPMGKVYITGIGTDYVKNPHHRVAVSKKTPVPGLVVAGPNNRVQVGSYTGGLGPKSYADLSENASCNEPAIDYNSPFVFLAGYFYLSSESK